MAETEPRVLCVMLTRDREALAAKAFQCFMAQTYRNRRLFVLNTGEKDWLAQGMYGDVGVYGEHMPQPPGKSIGSLRNSANDYGNQRCLDADIIAHWDDDDWSHPNRLTEQVALLQASGADAVGYNEMLFWRAPRLTFEERGSTSRPGEAWLYSNPRPNYALGTSLCYWRKTWERSPFTDGPKPEGISEYHHWFAVNNRIRVEAITSMGHPKCQARTGEYCSDPSPRMVARIHGLNTGSYDIEEQIKSGSREWERVPSWDARVAEILK